MRFSSDLKKKKSIKSGKYSFSLLILVLTFLDGRQLKLLLKLPGATYLFIPLDILLSGERLFVFLLHEWHVVFFIIILIDIVPHDILQV